MPASLTVDIALTPELLPLGGVYVVIDVIRATTMLCALFEAGATRVLVASGIAEARAARERLGAEYLLAGEVGGARPTGFDLGNSPSELSTWEVRGRQIILATTNGTRALHACRNGAAVFTAAFRNAAAVVSAALAATRNSEAPTSSTATAAAPTNGASEAGMNDSAAHIVFVCSGRGGSPAFDDTLCAGYLVSALLEAAHSQGSAVALGERALIARSVWNDVAQHGDLRAALASSPAGHSIESIGLSADLEWCAAIDATAIVPTLTRHPDDATADLLTVEPLVSPRSFPPQG